tara:strand:+ start:320 stop:463 length:144 start_codon:yes stop_codon:yes gene_type:complete
MKKQSAALKELEVKLITIMLSTQEKTQTSSIINRVLMILWLIKKRLA